VTAIKLKDKIENSASDFSGKTFLHTSPHHDDVMLAYLPFLSHLATQNTKHHFAIMASGSNSVTDEFLFKRLNNLEKYLNTISPDKNNIKIFLDALADNNFEQKEIAQASCLAYDILQIFDSTDIHKTLEQIKLDLGQKQLDKIKDLKAKIRDWEEELAWSMLGFNNTNLNFMKLGFYSDKSGQIDFQRDVKPVIDLIKKTDPDIITLAWENEQGHPTHIKVCKIVTQAIKCYLQECPGKKISVWGYRNVWCRFEPDQADLIFPVTLNDFVVLKSIFNISYGSQIKADTPSPEYDGPFCDFMQKIMYEQYRAVKACVGQEYFDNHNNYRVRAASGFCFIKFIEDFYEVFGIRSWG
jgi:glucosamine-6-phosphate deaminase